MSGLLAAPQVSIDPTAYAPGAGALAAPPSAPPPPPDPGVGALIAATPMQTPDEMLRDYAKHHALVAALRVLGGTMSDMGSAAGGSANSDAALADLRGRAAQPLQLAQAKARMAGLIQACRTEHAYGGAEEAR